MPAVGRHSSPAFMELARSHKGVKLLNPAVKKFTTLVSTLTLAALLALALPAIAADNAKQLYNKGRDAEARQDYEQAYEYFRQAFQKAPKEIKYRVAFERTRFLSSASHVHRGQILRDSGKLQEALAEFQKGLEIDPSSFIAQQEAQRTKRMMEEGAGGGPAPANRSNDMISRMVDRAAGPVELQPVSQTPLTLNVSEDARRVYTTIGQLAGINVLFDPEFGTHPVSVQLNGVTLAEALNIVALESHCQHYLRGQRYAGQTSRAGTKRPQDFLSFEPESGYRAAGDH